jgi:phage baseplate assembly protein gpV
MKEKLQLTDIIAEAIGEALSNLHTATIAKVTAVQEKTISVQPVINRVVDGNSITLPQFTKVPPLFMQGGGSYTAHPIAVGDYCLLILTERCFDRWYSGADFQDPAEFRMHDYSDGIAIVGVNPQAGALTIPAVIQQTGDTNQDGNYTHQGSRVHTGDHIQTGDKTQTGNYTITGNVTINGSITINAQPGDFVQVNGVTLEILNGDVIADGISLKTHVHSGVQPGAGTTGGPQ